MPNHTPGPWRVHKVGKEPTAEIWTDESHGSVLVAECAGMDRDANARLIAQAWLIPELAEALRWIIEGQDAGEKVRGPKVQHGIAEARALLAKLDTT